MNRSLSRKLHTLTARLDKGADAILRAEAGVSYSRFLALYLVGLEGADTQRALAQRLGVSEPSVSRMVRVLAADGWLESTSDPAGGNRNQLRLTPTGQQLVRRWGAELEARLAALVEAAGVPYRSYLTHTERLLAALDARPAQPASCTAQWRMNRNYGHEEPKHDRNRNASRDGQVPGRNDDRL